MISTATDLIENSADKSLNEDRSGILAGCTTRVKPGLDWLRAEFPLIAYTKDCNKCEPVSLG